MEKLSKYQFVVLNLFYIYMMHRIGHNTHMMYHQIKVQYAIELVERSQAKRSQAKRSQAERSQAERSQAERSQAKRSQAERSQAEQ